MLEHIAGPLPLDKLLDVLREFCRTNYPQWKRAALYISLGPEEPDAVLPVQRPSPSLPSTSH